MSSILEYFRRRPHSQVFLIRLLVYVIIAVLTRDAIDTETLVGLLAGVIGVDLIGTKAGERQTTPTDNPRLGAGREMPPELRAAALAVQTLLPGPIGELWEIHGEGLWALVKTAEKAAQRDPNQAEMKKRIDDRLGKP